MDAYICNAMSFHSFIWIVKYGPYYSLHIYLPELIISMV